MKIIIAILLGVIMNDAQAEGLLPCQLKTDKWLIYNPYTACLAGYAEVSGRVLADNDQTRSAGGYFGQVYGSVGLGHWISLHGRAAVKSLADPDHEEILPYAKTEQVFLQLGHPVSDTFYASVGRIDGPFGLNHDLYSISLPSRAHSLWITNASGGRIGVGRRDGLRLEAGTSNLDQMDPTTGESIKLVSGRIIKGIDLLDGTRLIASYATSSSNEERRIGLATLVHNENNKTSLEWIRQTQISDPDVFAQVFRFVHEQQQAKWTLVFGVEEIRRDSYRLSFGGRRNWIYSLVGSFSVHYQKEAWRPRDHWILMTGLGIGNAWSWEEAAP